jgi:alpha-beta hydrolase superfamily lysophospholipase
MTIERRESTCTGAGHMQLYTQAWLPPTPPRAVVALVHGFGEHCGRYTYLAEALADAGYALSSFDHRGHGHSPGLRGHIDQFGDFLQDVTASLAVAQAVAPGAPLFLMGHSMGGLIALNYAIRHPQGLEGVITSAPLLAQPNVAPWLNYVARLLSQIRPAFSLDTGVKPQTISRDPAEVARYGDDPYVHGRISARLGMELIAAQKWTQAHAADLAIPLLLYHGDADPLVPVAGSRTFFANVKVADKQFIEWPGGYHESHNDLHRAEVFAAIVAWLDKHHRPS